MTKHSLRLNPAEVLELSTRWQDEEQARGALAASSRRTEAALYAILERYDLGKHAGVPWHIRTEGDEVLICAEVPDPKPKDPPKLEGAALCAVEGHEYPEGSEGRLSPFCVRCSLKLPVLPCEPGDHAWRDPTKEEHYITGKVCKWCGQVSDEPANACKDGHDWERPAGADRAICNRGCGATQKLPLPKPVGGPGSKLTPAQVKRGRRKARKGAAAKAVSP